MKKSINWDNEEKFINLPTLSVTGWSDTGNEIICTTEEIISNNILTWDLKKKIIDYNSLRVLMTENIWN